MFNKKELDMQRIGPLWSLSVTQKPIFLDFKGTAEFSNRLINTVKIFLLDRCQAGRTNYLTLPHAHGITNRL